MKLNKASLLLAFAGFLVLPSCNSGKSEKGSADVIALNSDNFGAETAKGIVMVDFWASWCPPCRKMLPVIDQIASETRGKIKVGKVDVDANGELANRFKVNGIPDILIFKDGIEVENLVGLRSGESLKQVLGKYIKL